MQNTRNNVKLSKNCFLFILILSSSHVLLVEHKSIRESDPKFFQNPKQKKRPHETGFSLVQSCPLLKRIIKENVTQISIRYTLKRERAIASNALHSRRRIFVASEYYSFFRNTTRSTRILKRRDVYFIIHHAVVGVDECAEQRLPEPS